MKRSEHKQNGWAAVFLGEIKAREFAVIFSCGLVVCAGGFELSQETTQVKPAAIDVDVGIPKFAPVMEFSMNHALKFRRTAIPLSAILHILTSRGKLKISFSVVQAVMIGVVDEQSLRGFNDFVMHPDQRFSLPVGNACTANSIPRARTIPCMPFEFIQTSKILRVNDSVFEFCQGDEPNIGTQAKTAIREIYSVNEVFQTRCNIFSNSGHKYLSSLSPQCRQLPFLPGRTAKPSG